MSDTLKLTAHQASDVEAASEKIYSDAADYVLDTRTLDRDMLALATIFLIAVTYHIQNPLTQFNTHFGSAFRNATLQPVMAVGLAIAVFALIGGRRAFQAPEQVYGNGVLGNRTAIAGNPIKVAAAIILIVYTAYMLLAIVFGSNLSGTLFGIDQAVFSARLNDETPVAALESALGVMTVFEYLAIISAIILWHPWTRMPVYRRALRKQGAALAVAVVVIVLWEVLSSVFRIQEFLLPRPSVIGAAFAEVYPRLVSAGWNTFQNGFWGFVVGCGAGILTGFVSARFTSFSKALLPVSIAINAVPIIALAPIFNNWFGALNPTSKIAIVAVLTYFPAMISTVRGLTNVDALSLELMKSYAANQWHIFTKLRLPNALPYIFSALKVGTTLAMIGAIVSEYFGGATTGLGFRIRDDAGLFKYPEAWSAILIAALFGILFYLLVSAVERALLSWHVSFREK